MLASIALLVEDQFPRRARPPATVTCSALVVGHRSRGPRRHRGLMSVVTMCEEVRRKGHGRDSQGGEEQGLAAGGRARHCCGRARRWWLTSRSGTIGGQGQGKATIGARTWPMGPSRRVYATMVTRSGESLGQHLWGKMSGPRRHGRADGAEPPWPRYRGQAAMATPPGPSRRGRRRAEREGEARDGRRGRGSANESHRQYGQEKVGDGKEGKMNWYLS